MSYISGFNRNPTFLGDQAIVWREGSGIWRAGFWCAGHHDLRRAALDWNAAANDPRAIAVGAMKARAVLIARVKSLKVAK